MRLTRRAGLLAALTAASAARADGLEARLKPAALALPRLQAVIVARGGVPVFARAFRGRGLDAPANIKSASKSVLSALVGIAIGRGVLAGLDQEVAPLLGPLVPREAGPRVGAITIGDLLSMRAGLESTSGAGYGAFAASGNWVRHILTRPFVAAPGGAMIYSTGSSHLLSVALARTARRSTHALAQDWLGRPLGIAIPPWRRDPQGYFMGGNDMALSPRALLRFGELYRSDGMVGGVRVLPAGWVKQSWTPRGRSGFSGLLHGLGWWVGEATAHPTCFAWGYGGQMLYVTPDLELTAVMISEAEAPRDRAHQAGLHALFAEVIVPAVATDS